MYSNIQHDYNSSPCLPADHFFIIFYQPHMTHYSTLRRLMATTLYLLLLILSSVSTQAQTIDNQPIKNYKNAVALEMMGHGFAYTLSYERLILHNSFFKTTAQVGFAYYGLNSDATPLWIPITVNQLTQIGEGEFLELGVGKILRSHGPIFNDLSGIGKLKIEEWIMRLGFRYQHPNRRMLFKLAYTPFLRPQKMTHWCGLGFGVQF